MTYQEQIAREDEEMISREDLRLGSALNARINARRRQLHDRQPLDAPAADELYQVLGECAIALSQNAYERRENEVRRMMVGRLLEQMSLVEAPASAEVVQMPVQMPAAFAAAAAD